MCQAGQNNVGELVVVMWIGRETDLNVCVVWQIGKLENRTRLRLDARC